MCGRVRSLALVVLAGSFVLVGGCADLMEGFGGSEGGEDAWEDCEARSFEGEEGRVAWVMCEGTASGTNAQEVQCDVPEEASLTVRAQIDGGAILVVVEDADGERVVEERIEDTGAQPRNVSVADGAKGAWTLSVERLSEFEGSFRAELWCPR